MQQTTVFPFKKYHKTEKIDHMTIKPIDLMQRLMEVFSMTGQTVLDPFMGTGTTGIAALASKRKFIGFEIEKKYFDIAAQRLHSTPKCQSPAPILLSYFFVSFFMWLYQPRGEARPGSTVLDF